MEKHEGLRLETKKNFHQARKRGIQRVAGVGVENLGAQAPSETRSQQLQLVLWPQEGRRRAGG